MRLLEVSLRVVSIAGIVIASVAFVIVALVANLGETLTAAILFLSLIEVLRSLLALRYVKKSKMEIRRRELEMYRPTQWYSDRR